MSLSWSELARRTWREVVDDDALGSAALNRAYDIDEGPPWWKVRLVAVGLTLGVALIVLIALSLVLVGPTLAEKLGQTTGWGAPFEWPWLVLQWPLVCALVATGIGLVCYSGPDADQDWVWITPGAVAATIARKE